MFRRLMLYRVFEILCDTDSIDERRVSSCEVDGGVYRRDVVCDNGCSVWGPVAGETEIIDRLGHVL